MQPSKMFLSREIETGLIGSVEYSLWCWALGGGERRAEASLDRNDEFFKALRFRSGRFFGEDLRFLLI
jgi:hypothetical protein